MSLNARLQLNETELTIDVVGRFDFSVANEFRNSYRHLGKKDKYIINLAQVEYIDSAAIGMLLLLREFVEEDSKSRVAINNCSPEVRKVLCLAHMDKLFDMGR
jgi:anti-anti-sigma factor